MSSIAISTDGTAYRAGNLLIRHAEPADDQALRKILRDNPMQGWLRITLERDPSYFSGENLMGGSRTIIGQDTAQAGRVIGMYHTTFLPVIVNGEVVQAGYLGGLRVNQAYRNRLRVIKHGFQSILPLNQPETAATQRWFTSIASDNHAARRLLEANHRGLPVYTPAGELQTLAISVRHGKRPVLLQPATEADISAICAFHNRQASEFDFAPYLDPSWLLGPSRAKGLGIEDFWLLKQGERIEACIAIWDQRSYKQATVQGYRFPLGHLRPFYNLIAYLRGRPLLPRAPSRLESVYLSFLALSHQAHRHALPILREALYIAGVKNARIGLIGLAASNRLLPRLRSALHPTIYRTCIETVHWDDDEPVQPNAAPPQPEIAIL